jgi:hypothetical protein
VLLLLNEIEHLGVMLHQGSLAGNGSRDRRHLGDKNSCSFSSEVVLLTQVYRDLKLCWVTESAILRESPPLLFFGELVSGRPSRNLAFFPVHSALGALVQPCIGLQ